MVDLSASGLITFSGSADRWGRTHATAKQICDKEDEEAIMFFLWVVRLWIWKFFHFDIFAHTEHTMSDFAKAILNSFGRAFFNAMYVLTLARVALNGPLG